VPADPAHLRFFVDESVLGLGKALAIAREDVIHAGHRLIPEVPTGTLDPDWMPAVAARGLAVIARDRRIRTKPAELLLLHAQGLRVFWIAGRRDLNNWGYLTRVVRRWDDIERVVADRGYGPWFMEVREQSVVEFMLHA
jgi:hypothetical protein